MKTYSFAKLFRLLAVITVLGGFSLAVNNSQAQSIKDSLKFEESAPNEDGTNLGQGLGDLTKWVFYIFYLVGGIFMGIGAFKLKQGDMGGFGKNMAGGATLFFVPATIQLFSSIGKTAAGG